MRVFVAAGRRLSMRGLLGGVLALAVLAGPSAAAAPKRSTDPVLGARFHLAGDLLTVTFVPQPGLSPRDGRRRVWGRRVRAVCSPTWNDRRTLRTAARAVRTWPRGRARLSFRFQRDVSARVKWCLLEGESSGDIAFAKFPPIRISASSSADTKVAAELRRYLHLNGYSAPWFRQVLRIDVRNHVITIATRVRQNRAGRRTARILCNLIQGADVADFTPGHTIVGRGGVVVRRCRASRR